MTYRAIALGEQETAGEQVHRAVAILLVPSPAPLFYGSPALFLAAASGQKSGRQSLV
jgi:hypothetical protein